MLYNFKTFIIEEKDLPEITEEELDSMVNSLTWDDIADLYSDDDFVNENITEAISASERLKRSQRMRARKVILAMQRNVKLKRASPMPVLKRRSQIAARKMITKRLLKNRSKGDLSPSEKSMIEARAKRILKLYKNLPTKLMPKIRELERSRLSGAR
jgi:hypothetical protein